LETSADSCFGCPAGSSQRISQAAKLCAALAPGSGLALLSLLRPGFLLQESFHELFLFYKKK